MAPRLSFLVVLALLKNSLNTCYGFKGEHILNLLNTIGDVLSESDDIPHIDKNLILSKFEELSSQLSGKPEAVRAGTSDFSTVGWNAAKQTDIGNVTALVEILIRAFTGEKMYNSRTRRDVDIIKDRLEILEGKRHVSGETATMLRNQAMILSGLQQLEQRHANEDLAHIVSVVHKMATHVEKIYNKTVGVEHTKDKASGPGSCRDVKGGKSGVYVVYPQFQPSGVKVYCNMETDGGGWIVFQRRQDGFVDFFRGWDEYKNGFGDLNWEFWLGNDNIHGFTKERSSELRIDLVDENGNRGYAKYDLFKVDSKENKYKLSVQGYHGNVGDALEFHNNMKFSTKDTDNDQTKTLHCAEEYTGAWWYNACHHTNLNGDYFVKSNRGPRWWNWHKDETRMTYQEMKLRWKY